MVWRSWKDFWSFERVKRYEEVTGKQLCLDVSGAKGWFYEKMQTYLVPRYGIYIYTSSVNYGFAGSHGSRAHWVRTFWAQQNTYFSSWKMPCWFFELRVYAAGPASTNRWVGTVCTYFLYFTMLYLHFSCWRQVVRSASMCLRITHAYAEHETQIYMFFTFLYSI